MNIEEKAKAYDKALKQAKELLNSPRTCFDIDQLKDIFPQLRESEDERIRKDMCEWLKHKLETCTYPTPNKKTLSTWITYLEKQKERGPLTKEEEYVLHRIIEYLEDETCPPEWISLLHDIYCLPYEKQKEQELNPSNSVGLEQKPAEWSEDYQEENIQTRFAFYTYKDDPSTLYLSNIFVEEASRNHGFGTRILRAAEKVAETIGATTISLKVKQDSPANAWYRKNGYGYVTFEDGYDWLEKNLEYLKPNKSEWSEKEKNGMALDIIMAIRAYYKYKREDLVKYFKSLRPQPHWKPSEEQMGALKEALETYKGFEEYDAMKSLYNDLLKLM